MTAELMLIDEVGAILRCSHDQVLALVARGDLEAVRLGRKTVRIKPASLARLIN